MHETISSNLFEEFFNAYERGTADFLRIDGKNHVIERVEGGRLFGLEDLASRLPVISSAFLIQSGTQAPRDFRCLFDGPDVKEGESKVHFQLPPYGFWFYFSKPIEDELRIRLGSPGDIEPSKIEEFKLKLDKQFELGYIAEPKLHPGRHIKFTRGYLLGQDELNVATKLADSNDPVTGKMKPYWRSYRDLMMKPILRAMGETFPHGG